MGILRRDDTEYNHTITLPPLFGRWQNIHRGLILIVQRRDEIDDDDFETSPKIKHRTQVRAHKPQSALSEEVYFGDFLLIEIVRTINFVYYCWLFM